MFLLKKIIKNPTSKPKNVPHATTQAPTRSEQQGGIDTASAIVLFPHYSDLWEAAPSITHFRPIPQLFVWCSALKPFTCYCALAWGISPHRYELWGAEVSAQHELYAGLWIWLNGHQNTSWWHQFCHLCFPCVESFPNMIWSAKKKQFKVVASHLRICSLNKAGTGKRTMIN